MTPILPDPIAAYFAAQNGHDPASVAACFGIDATVHDEGREHRGTDAIRRWQEDVVARYAVHVEPVAVERSAGVAIVTVTATGRFPGSPLTLRHTFTLEGSSIARLEIGA
jgi:hypothetical protein